MMYMLEDLKKQVLEANLLLPQYGLVTFTWGNVSGIDRGKEIIAIKPSGVPYETMEAKDIVLCDMEGHVIEGERKPSSDLWTHIKLYQSFTHIGGVVHTHSHWATAYAQAGSMIPAMGTTQADYFYGDIPCTRQMTKEEIQQDYELQTGNVIVETFLLQHIDPNKMPGVLVNDHGPFAWGEHPLEAAYHAKVLEECAGMAFIATLLNPKSTNRIQNELLDKHFSRKHGPHAYYGQT